ncbi:extracellular solute-binding protein [Ruminococcaceae bacterium OttesenSCG-928-L11]|nr:extracellular solute-binding protein [Ruminococcaceae bacterium OttesenSCG-928-L11]
MKRMKRFVSTATALLLVAGLCACAGSGTSSTGSGGTTSSAAPAASSTAPAASGSTPAAPAAETIEEAIGFEAVVVPFPAEPLMKYPVENGGKITIWIPLQATVSKYYQTLRENATVQQFIKDTGIDVEFVHPPSGQEKENFNLLVVSDSLPDILSDCNKHYAGGESAAVGDGVFADLTDLVAQYAPDYNYFLENNDLFRKLATTSDNKVYSIYNYKDVQAPYYHRPQLRADWLNEWGMEIPITFDDWEKYFDKVLAEKPGVAPWLPIKNGIEGTFLGAFEIGGHDNGKRFFVKEGQIHYTFNEPRLLEYLELMNKWYTKGYISKDFTTVDRMDNEFANGKVAALVGNTDTLYTLANELDYEVATTPYPRVKDGDAFHFDIFYFPQNGNPNTIAAKSKNKELALQWLNYGFTQHGSGVANFGETGVTWEMGADGVPVFTDYALNNPDIPMSDAEYTLRLHTCWAKYRYGDDISMIRNVALPDTWDYRAKWGMGDDPNPCDNAYALPTLSFTTEAASEIGKLTTDIDTYAEEMILKFITGATPLSEFDTFVKNCEALGMPRLIQLYQEAYDAFLAK